MAVKIPFEDLDPETQEVINKFKGKSPSAEGLPNTIVLRDGEGNVLGHYLLSKAPNVSEVSGAVAFRVDKNDGRIQFCDNHEAVRKFLGLPNVFIGEEAPVSPGEGDFWIDEGE